MMQETPRRRRLAEGAALFRYAGFGEGAGGMVCFLSDAEEGR